MNGTTIRQARKAKGMTQVQLARAVGTGQSYISALENSEQSNVTVELLQRIADALGMTISITLLDPQAQPADEPTLPLAG